MTKLTSNQMFAERTFEEKEREDWFRHTLQGRFYSLQDSYKDVVKTLTQAISEPALEQIRKLAATSSQDISPQK